MVDGMFRSLNLLFANSISAPNFSCVSANTLRATTAVHNAFSSRTVSLWKQPIDYRRCSNWWSFAFSHACGCILHWSAALSTTLCGTLVQVSMMHWFMSPVSHVRAFCTHVPASVSNVSNQPSLVLDSLVATDLDRWTPVFCVAVVELSRQQSARMRCRVFKVV